MNVEKLIHQKSYERVEHIYRRNAITFVPIMLLFLLLFSVGPVFYVMFQTLVPAVFTDPLWYPAIVLGASVYYLSLLLFFFTQFVDFYLDLWIVTNDRIIDIEQFGLFSRTISELDLFRIQDVTTDVHGLFPTVFGYGNVNIKTASTNINIVFKNVSDPNSIRGLLLDLAEQDRKYHIATEPKYEI